MWKWYRFTIPKWLTPAVRAAVVTTAVDGLNKVQTAAEIAALDRPGSETTLNIANAGSKLIKSLKGVSEAAIRMDQILIVKTTSLDGREHVVAMSMSPTQRRMIDQNPSLLLAPAEILQKLQILEKGKNQITLIEADSAVAESTSSPRRSP